MSLYHIQETSDHEYLYHCANLSESNWLLGTEVKFYTCIKYTRDVASDPHPEWSQGATINMLFDDNPKATLRKLNWMAEDENLPYLVYISNIVWPSFKKFKNKYDNNWKSIKSHFDSAFNKDKTPSVFNDFWIDVTRYSKVVVPYSMQVEGTQKFIVTDLQGDSINPFIWLCKLAPYREQVDINPATQQIDRKLTNDEDAAISGHTFLRNMEFK